MGTRCAKREFKNELFEMYPVAPNSELADNGWFG